MELGLSLGETQKQYRKSQETVDSTYSLGFCMGLSSNSFISSSTTEDEKIINTRLIIDDEKQIRESCSDPLLQLHLLPFSPLHKPSHLPLNQQVTCEPGNGTEKQTVGAEEDGGTGSSSSPKSTIISSFRIEYGNYCRNKSNKNRDKFEENNRQVETAGRGGISDDEEEEEEEENGLLARKKLRLTKDQSAFLEESFKQHNTLNPKQKLGLAKQLNLRPRQVEVWFQNRRARTKLKQTEVDCEYLKRCCETLTEENRRLQKELLELRTLKSSDMQLPATTLAMCPSCERTTTASAPTPAAKPILHTFLQDQGHALQPV